MPVAPEHAGYVAASSERFRTAYDDLAPGLAAALPEAEAVMQHECRAGGWSALQARTFRRR